MHEREFQNSDVIKMLKSQASQPVLTPIVPLKCYSFVKTVVLLETYFGEDTEKWPKPLAQIKHFEQDLAMNAMGLTIAFL